MQWTNIEYFIIMFSGGFQFQRYCIIRYFTGLTQQLWQSFHTYKIRTVEIFIYEHDYKVFYICPLHIYTYIYIEQGLVLWRFVLRHFTITTLVESEHSRLVARHCPNSSILSLISALLALFRCACVSSFSILVQFFWVDCYFFTHDVHQIDRKEEKIKTADLTTFLDVFWTTAWAFFSKIKLDLIDIFLIICVIFYILNSLN